MMTTHEKLDVQLERVRTLIALLAHADAARGGQYDELLDRTRAAIADVRQTRARLAASGRRSAARPSPSGLLIDFQPADFQTIRSPRA